MITMKGNEVCIEHDATKEVSAWIALELSFYTCAGNLLRHTTFELIHCLQITRVKSIKGAFRYFACWIWMKLCNTHNCAKFVNPKSESSFSDFIRVKKVCKNHRNPWTKLTFFIIWLTNEIPFANRFFIHLWNSCFKYYIYIPKSNLIKTN